MTNKSEVYEKIARAVDEHERDIGYAILSYYLDENDDVWVFTTATKNFRPEEDGLELILQTDRQNYLANLDDDNKYFDEDLGKDDEGLEFADYLEVIMDEAFENLDEIR